MRHEGWARRLRKLPFFAAIGVALGGCVCCGPRHFGDDGRQPGFAPYARNQVNEIDYIKALAGKR